MPRAWFTRLHDFFSIGFILSKTDVSLFIYSTGYVQLYLLVYVDNILVVGFDSAHVSSLVSKMAIELKVCDMGSLSFFLGIELLLLFASMLLSQAGRHV